MKHPKGIINDFCIQETDFELAEKEGLTVFEAALKRYRLVQLGITEEYIDVIHPLSGTKFRIFFATKTFKKALKENKFEVKQYQHIPWVYDFQLED